MLIQNRKTEITHEVTAEEWAKLGKMQMQILFKVLDKNTVALPTKKINIPSSIREFQDKLVESQSTFKPKEK